MTSFTPKSDETDKASQDFQQQAAADQVGIVREFIDFLMHNKKWWLTPIILTLLLVGLLVILGGTAAAPFVYTLF